MEKTKELEVTQVERVLYFDICLHCCWGKVEGNVLFCPFKKGTCMRKDPVFRNAMYGGTTHEQT